MPVTNVHMMGDIEVMGDGGLKCSMRREARPRVLRVNITTNARSSISPWSSELQQDAGEARRKAS